MSDCTGNGPVRSEYFFQLDQISGGVHYFCSLLTWWIEMLHLQQQLPLVVVSSGPGALLLRSMILGDNSKLASLWVLAMSTRNHPWLTVVGCVWLGSRVSDGKKLLSLAGMLGDILWGAVEPLVYCGFISVAPECFLVFCSGLDDEEGIAIIHFLVPDILQWWYPCFYLLRLCDWPPHTTSCFLPSFLQMLLLLGVLSWGNCRLRWYGPVCRFSHDSSSSTSIYHPCFLDLVRFSLWMVSLFWSGLVVS